MNQITPKILELRYGKVQVTLTPFSVPIENFLVLLDKIVPSDCLQSSTGFIFILHVYLYLYSFTFIFIGYSYFILLSYETVQVFQ